MGKTTPSSRSLPPGGGRQRVEPGGQLLKELEALSAALYNAGQAQTTATTITTPLKNLVQDSVPSHLSKPPSPYLGAIRSDAEQASPPSPYLNNSSSYGGGAKHVQVIGGSYKRSEPPSPYLGTLNGNGGTTPTGMAESPNSNLGRMGSRREGGSKPPLLQPTLLNLDVEQQPSKSSSSVHCVGGRREVIPPSAAGLDCRQVAKSPQSQGYEAPEVLSPLMSGLWSLENGEEKDEIQPRPLSIIEEVVPEIDGGKNQSKWFHIVKSKPRNPFQSPKSASLNPLQSPKVTSRNPFQSPKLAALNPLQSPKLASLNPFQSPKLVSLNPFQSPKLASLNPLQSPKSTSINHLQSPKVASGNSFHSPKLASLNPLQSPKLASLNPFQSPKVISQNLLQSPKLASTNFLYSPKLTSLNPFHSPGLIPLKDSGKRKFETYKLDRRGRVGPEVVDPALQAWHSQDFQKHDYNDINNGINNINNINNSKSNRKRSSKEVGNINFPAWLKDNDHLTKSLEVPNNEKRSLWSWKPFRAIAHIRQQRFNCMFTVHVHEIKDLPAVLNGVRLVVQFKRRDSMLQTMPSRVFHGLAEVEEMLNIKSTVYATKSSNNGMMKYTPKNFNLAVVAPDIDELVLGMHRLDLSRLLPESTEVSFDDEGSKTWTTRFKLVGKAKGGILVVTFGYQLLNKDSQPTKTMSSARFDSPLMRPLRFYSSLPSSPQELNNSSSDVQFSPAFPEFPSYMRMEHLNLDDNPNDHRFINSKSGHESFQRQQPESNGLNQEVHNKHATIPQAAAAARASNEKLLNQASRIMADSAEFTVLHVSSTLNRSSLDINPDDPLTEEDTIEGMLKADAVNLVEDPALAWTKVGADVWDLMQLKGKEEVLSDDKFVTTEIEAIEVNCAADERTSKRESLECITDLGIADALASDNNNVTDVTNGVKEEAEEDRKVKCINVDSNGENVQKSSTSTSPLDSSVDLPTIESTQNHHIHEEEDEVPLLGDLDYEDEKIKMVFEDEGFLQSGMGGTNLKDMDRETQRHGHGHVNSNDFEAVTGEFLSFLRDDNESVVVSSSESSPRARLLREFEKETLFTDSGLGGWDFLLSEDSKFLDETLACDELKLEEAGKSDMNDSSQSISGRGSEEEFELSCFVEVAEAEFQRATNEQCGKSEASPNNVTSLEPCKHTGPETHVEEKWSFNNGILDAHKPAVAIMPPPPPHHSTSSETIKKAPGPVLLIRDGGSLRSVSPLQFQVGESSISGHLMMQVSRPVIVPSEERATSIDILRQLAMAGMEGMAMKAMMAMPLEDITGKAFDQIAMEAKVPVHRDRLGGVATINGSQEGNSLSRMTNLYHSDGNMLDDYLLLHDLAPMALEKIESIALEGLKVQTGEGEDERQIEYAAFGKDLEADLMSQAISLDEWLQFNLCAVNSVNNENCHNHFPLLAAGMTSIYNTDLVVYEKQQMVRDKEKSLPTISVDAARGFTTGGTVTLTMLVQLRDPLQNNKAVGAPMMAIIQAERVMVPGTQNLSLHFKIVDITVSGLNSSCSTQSMGKAHSTPKLRSNSGVEKESLWSFSAYCRRQSNVVSDCWQDILEVNHHVRNPDIVFPNSTLCTK